MLPRSTPFLLMPSEYSIEKETNKTKRSCAFWCALSVSSCGGTLSVDRFAGSREVRQHPFPVDEFQLRTDSRACSHPVQKDQLSPPKRWTRKSCPWFESRTEHAQVFRPQRITRVTAQDGCANFQPKSTPRRCVNGTVTSSQTLRERDCNKSLGEHSAAVCQLERKPDQA